MWKAVIWAQFSQLVQNAAIEVKISRRTYKSLIFFENLKYSNFSQYEKSMIILLDCLTMKSPRTKFCSLWNFATREILPNTYRNKAHYPRIRNGSELRFLNRIKFLNPKRAPVISFFSKIKVSYITEYNIYEHFWI